MDKVIEVTQKVENAVGDIGASLKKFIKAGRQFFEEVRDIIDEASEESPEDHSSHG